MKRYSLQRTIVLSGILTALLFNSCSNEIVKDVQSDKEDFYGTINNFPDSLIMDENNARIYTMPTPLQISSAIKIYGFRYNSKLLLPAIRTLHYTSNFSRSLNLGIRTIDLGYATVYSDNGRAFEYLKNVKQLTEELGIDGYERAQIVERFEKNIQNQDSLYKIVIEGYRYGHDYFQNNSRNGLGLLILTGCFVEGLHLTMGMENANVRNDEKYLNLLMQQKLYLKNLLELFAFYSNAPDIQWLMRKLNSLHAEFEKIHLNYDGQRIKPLIIHEIIPPAVHDSIESKITAMRNEIVE